jgi:SAM-dependent methyltransferase
MDHDTPTITAPTVPAPAPVGEGAYRCLICGHELPDGAALTGVDRLLGVPGSFSVQICAKCGAGVTFPLASADELGAYYPDLYNPHDLPGGVAALALAAFHRVREWMAFRRMPLSALADVRPGRLVDVGCGRGDLGAALLRRGWRVTGVEPSPGACETARRRGIDARQGSLETVDLEAGAYDAATFQHSLEHVPDPVGDLRRVHAALAENGVVVISVPNFDSWQRPVFRGAWFPLDLPRHRVHFTRRALATALARAGFDLVDMRTSTLGAGLPASVQYALAGRCLFPGGWRFRIAVAATAFTYPFVVAADRVGGGGDLLHAVARPRA